MKGIQNGDREHDTITHMLHYSIVEINPLKLLRVFMNRNKNGGKANTLYLTINYETLKNNKQNLATHFYK